MAAMLGTSRCVTRNLGRVTSQRIKVQVSSRGKQTTPGESPVVAMTVFRSPPNGGTAHSRHENRLQNNNKGCAAKLKVAHAPANILDHLSAKWRCTNPSHSKVYPYLTAHDFRVDCELCRHWGLSRRTGAKQNCAGGVEERRGRSRFFAGAKQNGAGAKQNGGGEEEGVSWGFDDFKIVKTPPFAESVTEGDVRWEKAVGDYVNEDEVVGEIETDKTSIPVPSPVSGVIEEFLAADGDTVTAGQELFKVKVTALAGGAPAEKPAPAAEKPAPAAAPAPAPPQPAAPAPAAPAAGPIPTTPPPLPPLPQQPITAKPVADMKPVAAAAPAMGVTAGARTENRVKMNRMRQRIAQRLKDAQNECAMLTTFQECDMSNVIEMRSKHKDGFLKKHGVKLGFMSPFVKAAAFALQDQPVVNAVIEDKEIVYRDYIDISVAVATPRFQSRAHSQITHSVKNPQILSCHSSTLNCKFGQDSVLKGSLVPHPSVSLGVEIDAAYPWYCVLEFESLLIRGLVVPVIRDVGNMNYADIEKTIQELGEKARKGELAIEDMDGGTFTISNGGVFGSMFGTPIINQPQSAILGMHAILDRPMAINGKVEIRPMMYLALTYDHRLIDGREAVTFLRKIKSAVEDPRVLVLDL
ncbi:hypothetical protein Bbelb_440480 [Branchiostoma belcheri]|nr:hypothetical protein Bbelb_440480 [Branchiostoma belcheri]